MTQQLLIIHIYYNIYGGPTIHHRSSREIRWTPRERLLPRLLADFSRETPHERLADFLRETPRERLLGAGVERNNQPDDNDGDG